ncbi:MAG: hypothetical protein IKS93_01760, partial [Methanobrevibacter sp.]|nr:hypothetical protein [Methanobrevibacter sp.]
MVVLFFSISSISAQSVNNLDDFENGKILKSDSLSNKTALNTTSKAKANTTNSTKKTNATKANTTKAKENKTTVNKKTLAKTSTSFMNYVEKN